MTHKNEEHQQSEPPEIRDRAIRLFKYLLALTELRSKTIRTLDQYEKVLWFGEVPERAGCQCIAWAKFDQEALADNWIEIKKPRRQLPPPPPKNLEQWIDSGDLRDSGLECPPLRERILLAPTDGENENQSLFLDRSKCPEVYPAWEKYVAERWWPWAEQDRELQQVQDIYTDLFSIHQKQTKLGEAYEVVVGLGFLRWKAPDQQEIRRHLVTARTSITFDSATGLITVGPAGQGAKPALEQDMLDPKDRPRPTIVNALSTELESIGDSLWDGPRTKATLKSWVHEVSASGTFEDTLLAGSAISEDPVVAFAPAVILRRRSDRSLLQVFRTIIDQLNSGAFPVPIGIQRLVTILDDERRSSADDAQQNPSITSRNDEVYFPLPANDAQVEIVRRLAHRQGVLVQGPPGTGKSHTIANLISHLLAQGKRVLITSHTARALKVLKAKLPPSLSALCVSLLGDDVESLQALEDSVRGIMERFNTWNGRDSAVRTIRIEKELSDDRTREASLLAELRSVRESQTFSHPLVFGKYSGTTQQIARALRQDESKYRWITDFSLKSEVAPLAEFEIRELKTLSAEISDKELAESRLRTCDLVDLITPSNFSELARTEEQLLSKRHTVESSEIDPRFKRLVSLSAEVRGELAKAIDTCGRSFESFDKSAPPWARRALSEMLEGRERLWREIRSSTREAITRTADKAKRVQDIDVTGCSQREFRSARADAQNLLNHLRGGGGMGFGPLKPKVVRESKQLLEAVRVDSKPCSKAQMLELLIDWIDVNEALRALEGLWEGITEPPVGSFASRFADYTDSLFALDRVFEFRSQIDQATSAISSKAGLEDVRLRSAADIRSIGDVCAAADTECQLIRNRNLIDASTARLRAAALLPNVHPSLQAAVKAIDARNAGNYATAFFSVESVNSIRKRLERAGTSEPAGRSFSCARVRVH